ncbi:beta strand repeat-containing protein [Oleiharenicola lentus]|uniref:beta strand repeat-containing protein n=1 Tax=Oleiharenicola lentus TaxID=2508720 RepID=UPI003F670383
MHHTRRLSIATLACVLLALPGSLSAQQTYTNGDTNTSNITANSPTIFTIASGTATQNGIISGDQVRKEGAGELHFSGNNTYSGGTTIDAGTLVGAHNNAFGSESITLSGGALRLSGDTAVANNITVTGAATVGSTGTGSQTYNGTLAVNAATTLDSASAGYIRFTNNITGTGALTFTGANTGLGDFKGRVLLDYSDVGGSPGNLSYAGSLTVNSGAVLQAFANLSSAHVQLNNGGQLWVAASGNRTLTIGSLSGDGVVRTIAPEDTIITLDVGSDNSSSTFSGSVRRQYDADDQAFFHIALTKTGTGTFTLSGNNIYTGGTTVSAGTLAISGSGTLGTGDLTLNGGTFDLGGTTQGASTAIFAGGTAQNGTLSANAFDARSGTISANLTSTAALTKTTSGTLTLSGTNDYSGGTTINAGLIAIDADSRLGSGALTLNGGGIRYNAAFNDLRAITLGLGGGTLNTNGQTISLANGASGSGSLNFTGNGTVNLSGSLTHTGGTSVDGGTLRLQSAGALGSGDFTVNGGTTVAVGDYTYAIGALNLVSGTLNRNYTGAFNATAFNVQSGIIATGLTGSGALTKTGSGTVELRERLTYTGNTYLNEGTLTLRTDIANSTLVHNHAGTTLRLDPFTSLIRLGGLQGNQTVDLRNASNAAITVIVGGNNSSTAYSGAFTGTGNFSKTGSGTLTLSGTSSHTGYTSVGDGTLIVNGSVATSNHTEVAGSGRLSGSGTVGALTLYFGGSVAPGNSPGTLNAGNTTWNGGASYEWEINNSANPSAPSAAGTNYDLLSISGTLTINATQGNEFTIKLASLLANNTSGDALNFNAAQNYTYTIASATGGILGFDADAFTINSTGFTNATNGGVWALTLGNSSRNLNLNFTAAAAAIPEPSTYAAIFGALALGLTIYRKRKGKGF